MRSLIARFALLALLPLGPVFAKAQSHEAVEQSARIHDRVAQDQLTPLAHHLPPYAVDSVPSVPLNPTTQLNGVILMLSRAPQVEAAFNQLLEDQQNHASPRYHQWLTPQQVGTLYGPAQSDIDAVSQWLTASGLTVTGVSPSRTQIIFNGSIQTLSSVFATSFRNYSLANGEHRFSISRDPSVPSAIFPVVSGIAGFSQVVHHPQLRHSAFIPTAKASGSSTHPQVTAQDGSHFLLDSDFNIAFDINAALAAGFTGSGQTIAVAGLSRINPDDVTNLETISGESARSINTVIPTDGADPGPAETTYTASNKDNGDQDEATVDVDRASGTATGAGIDLVVSSDVGAGDTYATDGLFIAINYAINTLNDPILTISFGGCEGLTGQAGTLYESSIFQQAASQGITTFISSDDSGAAGCNFDYSTIPATQQLSINDLCASQYVTCVGGTEFADLADPSKYWSATNGSSDSSSILGYIPEGAWNDITAPTSSAPDYSYGGTGGGLSVYIDRPSWQVGTGLLTSTFREVPDVALPSSTHDGFVTCLAYLNATCYNGFYSFGGTSVAAPSMAGIQAITNQKLGGRQGNMNPTIYGLAGSTTNVFHDATVATSAVAGCALTTPSMCNNSTPTNTTLTGGLQGYLLTTGWDAVTGWGSLDVNNFINAAATDALAATTSALTAAPTTITTAQTVVFTDTVTSTTAGTLTGTVQFSSNGTDIGNPVTLTNGVAATSQLSFPTAGTYTIQASYSGDTVYAGSVATLSFVVTGPVLPATTITISTTTQTVSSTQAITFKATVAPSGSGTGTPTGTVQFQVDGTNRGPAVALVSGTATSGALFFTPGTHTVTASYSGDSNFAASKSAATTVTSTITPTTIAFTTAPPATVASTDTIPLSATVSGLSASVASVASVVFKDGSTTLATFTPTSSTTTIVAAVTVGPLSAGAHNITATFTGDTNYSSSTTPVVVITVTGPGTVTLTPTKTTLTLTAGSSTTDVVNVVSAGFVGTQSLNCAVNFNGPGSATDIPTCAFNPTSVTFTATGATTLPSTITISSVAASARKSGPAASNRMLNLTSFGGITLASLLLIVLPRRSRRAIRAARLLASVLFLAATFATLAGCGSGSTTITTPTDPGTTKGSYDVTINSNSNLGGTNNVGYSGTISLTVQ